MVQPVKCDDPFFEKLEKDNGEANIISGAESRPRTFRSRTWFQSWLFWQSLDLGGHSLDYVAIVLIGFEDHMLSTKADM